MSASASVAQSLSVPPPATPATPTPPAQQDAILNWFRRIFGHNKSQGQQFLTSAKTNLRNYCRLGTRGELEARPRRPGLAISSIPLGQVTNGAFYLRTTDPVDAATFLIRNGHCDAIHKAMEAWVTARDIRPQHRPQSAPRMLSPSVPEGGDDIELNAGDAGGAARKSNEGEGIAAAETLLSLHSTGGAGACAGPCNLNGPAGPARASAQSIPSIPPISSIPSATSTATASSALGQNDPTRPGTASEPTGTFGHLISPDPPVFPPVANPPPPAALAMIDPISPFEQPTTSGGDSRNAYRSNEPKAQGGKRKADESSDISEDERHRRLKQVVRPKMDRVEAIAALCANGWACRTGSGLSSYIYCCSKYAALPTAEVKKVGRRGVEYFEGEEEVLTFCRDKLDWIGDSASSSTATAGKKSRADRAAKRQKVRADGLSVPPEPVPEPSRNQSEDDASATGCANANASADEDPEDEVVPSSQPTLSPNGRDALRSKSAVLPKRLQLKLLRLGVPHGGLLDDANGCVSPRFLLEHCLKREKKWNYSSLSGNVIQCSSAHFSHVVSTLFSWRESLLRSTSANRPTSRGALHLGLGYFMAFLNRHEFPPDHTSRIASVSCQWTASKAVDADEASANLRAAVLRLLSLVPPNDISVGPKQIVAFERYLVRDVLQLDIILPTAETFFGIFDRILLCDTSSLEQWRRLSLTIEKARCNFDCALAIAGPQAFVEPSLMSLACLRLAAGVDRNTNEWSFLDAMGAVSPLADASVVDQSQRIMEALCKYEENASPPASETTAVQIAKNWYRERVKARDLDKEGECPPFVTTLAAQS